MPIPLTGAVLLSAILFLGYGGLVLFSGGMRAEFERFGLPRLRRLTGALEVLGGVGLLVGLAEPVVLALSAGGLAVLMLLGVAVRVRVRDRMVEIVPAAVLIVLNAGILAAAITALPGA
jgi:hypothetical protein